MSTSLERRDPYLVRAGVGKVAPAGLG